MSKSIKLKDNNYWDSSSVVHDTTPLDTKLAQLEAKLNQIHNYDANIVEVGTWYGSALYRISRSIKITDTGNQAVLKLPDGAIVKMCNAWLYKSNSVYSNLVNWNDDDDTSDFGVLYYNRNTSQIFINCKDEGYLQLVIYFSYK